MNIFTQLKRGNIREEEYFSSSLAYILQSIPELTNFLIKKLGIENKLDEYEVVLESSYEEGRFDIVIKSLSIDIYFENKISDDRIDRLKDYKKHLTEDVLKETKLIFLTRDYIDDKTIREYVDKYIFWSELYGFIEEFLNKKVNRIKNFKDVKIYLIKEFLEFLREENMSNEKVSWEYEAGIASYLNLMNMLETTVKELEKNNIVKNMSSGGKRMGGEYSGIYINKKDFWVGVYLEEPEKICFEFLSKFRKKYPDDEEEFDKMEKSPSNEKIPSKIYDINKTYFLAFSKKKQKRELRKFIKESLLFAEKIESEKK